MLYIDCTHPDAHIGHLMMNGECPWCGYADPLAIEEDLTIRQIEQLIG